MDMNVAIETGNRSDAETDGSESRVDDGAAKTSSSSASASASSSSCVFRAIPPFLQKLFEMLGNDEFSPVVSWSSAGTSFVIKDPHSFAAQVLPLYYKHNNIQSFTTQLHSYGFKKVSWAQCEYKNEYFRRGERNLLKNIKRRDHYSKISKQPSSSTVASATTSSCSAIMKEELIDLKVKHDYTKAEITKLKEKQQILDEKFTSLKRRTVSIDEEQERLMVVAKRILEKQKVGGILPMLEESGETVLRKGKRKLEVQSDITQDNEEKGMFEEEGMAKHLPDAFFSLEELCGGPMDWVQYVKELQENANYNLKPSTDQESV